MAYYDDREFDYDQFWAGRRYEHASEIVALEELVGDRSWSTVVDVGGGSGRLTRWLAGRGGRVFLVEPSAKMRQLAQRFLRRYPGVVVRAGTAADTNLPTALADLVVMVRVMHHLPNPTPALVEARRILKPRGLLVLEFANSSHFLARIRSWLAGRPIRLDPVEKRRPENVATGTIPFVNHHPITVSKQLKRQGFKPLRILSVSNLRHRLFKSALPLSVLVGLESFLQSRLAPVYFGPSIFILAQKGRIRSAGIDSQ